MKGLSWAAVPKHTWLVLAGGLVFYIWWLAGTSLHMSTDVQRGSTWLGAPEAAEFKQGYDARGVTAPESYVRPFGRAFYEVWLIYGLGNHD